MKSLKAASVATALVLSTSVNAAVISYGGYTHDTTTNIVTGNGLEWLQWDVTAGESINSIQSQLNTLDGGGWSIASNLQMAELFNAFDFGITFDSDESTYQDVSTPYTVGDLSNGPHESFILMFGDTYAASGMEYCYGGECAEYASALFGTDADGDTFFNSAYVRGDYNSGGTLIDAKAIWYDDSYSSAFVVDAMGVALVRDVSAVPVPAAAWLFGAGMLGLIGVARRKKAV